MNLEQLEEIVTNLEDFDFVSPYKAVKIVNSAFGINLPPQMVYNYVKKGYITISKNTTGKFQISKEDLQSFMIKYGSKNLVGKE